MSNHEDDTYELDQLRVRNRLVTSRLKKAQKAADENFTALCDISAAKAVLYQIWEAADLSCDPQDYDAILSYATTAIAAYQVSQVSEEA